MSFTGQTVLVTGASRGIGAFLTKRFRAAGACVAAGARSLAAADHGAAGFDMAVDVTDEAALRRFVRAAHGRHGRLDVLINNAGAASMNPALLTPTDALRAAAELNYIAAFAATREAAKLMRRRQYGRVVNLTTIAVPLRLEGELAYAASKAALETATRVLARELAPLGITCNLVGPSPVDTDLIRGVPEGKMQALLDRLPLRSKAELDDVAYAVECFARPEAGQLTGQVLYLGGVG